MTALDWIVLLVWTGITLGGFWKGAVRIVFGVGGLLLGVWLAIMLGPEATDWWRQWLGNGWAATVLGHAGLALAAVAVCLLAAWGVDRTVSALKLGWLNRIAGAAVAGVAAALVLALAVAAAVRVSPVCRELSQRSLLVPRLIGAVAAAPQPAAASDASGSEPSAPSGR
jgi:uncharacterized membrane protein required for colicin V production